jgi:hypothetical protein
MAKIKGVFLPDSVDLVSNVSSDRQAVTVMIEKLRVTLGGVSGPLTVSRAATILVPLDMADADLTVRQVVRGVADVRPGARAVLLAQLGGQTVQIELPKPDTEDKNYAYTLLSTLPKGAPYQATLFLLLERDVDRPEIGGDITVESLDIEIQPPTKAGA